MRRIFSACRTRDVDTPPEIAVPPHPERPVAASTSTLENTHRRAPARRRTLRAWRLAAAAAAVAVLASACVYDPSPGPHATAGPSAAAAATPPGTPPLEHWYALAQCETGGNWGAPGPTYVGGLGMYGPNWAANGGLVYAPAANLATPEQQIAVATNLWLAGGSWGCKVGDGWDHR